MEFTALRAKVFMSVKLWDVMYEGFVVYYKNGKEVDQELMQSEDIKLLLNQASDIATRNRLYAVNIWSKRNLNVHGT